MPDNNPEPGIPRVSMRPFSGLRSSGRQVENRSTSRHRVRRRAFRAAEPANNSHRDTGDSGLWACRDQRQLRSPKRPRRSRTGATIGSRWVLLAGPKFVEARRRTRWSKGHSIFGTSRRPEGFLANPSRPDSCSGPTDGSPCSVMSGCPRFPRRGTRPRTRPGRSSSSVLWPARRTGAGWRRRWSG